MFQPKPEGQVTPFGVSLCSWSSVLASSTSPPSGIRSGIETFICVA
jgi:hypothetical protein